jgi:transcriptional regulator with XRE-family HTH domain
MAKERYGRDFGNKIRDLRLGMRLSLRKFASDNKMDSGNLSKIERGVLPPPSNIAAYAKAFGFIEGSPEWIELDQLARSSLAAKSFVNVDDEVAKKLPQFFRTIDNKNLTSEKLEKLLEVLKEI